MGLAQHYSLDLPERCLVLLEELWPYAEKTTLPREQHLGPLTTTFLLALATPIITLPIERVQRHRAGAGYADDRPLDPHVAAAVDAALNGHPFRRSPFFEGGEWRYFEMPYRDNINIARRLPEEAIQGLAANDAASKADRMPAEQWATCVRNALAHGGIAYLDATGAQSHDARAEALVFVSAKYPRSAEPVPPEKLRFLRISEKEFYSFLRRWVDWLQESKLPLGFAV